MAETSPNSVNELLIWCRDAQAELRKLLRDDPSLISELFSTTVRDYAVRVAAFAVSLLPSDLADQVPSPGYLLEVRSVIGAVEACERACESALLREHRFALPVAEGAAGKDKSGPPPQPADNSPSLFDAPQSLLSDPPPLAKPLLLGHLLSYYPDHEKREPRPGLPVLSVADRVIVENDSHHLAIIDVAEELGCCEQGAFGCRSVRKIRLRFARTRRVNGDEADATPLSVIEEFLEELLREQQARSCGDDAPRRGTVDDKAGRTNRRRSGAEGRRGSQGGRPRDTDEKADERVSDAWRSGHYKTYEELGNVMNKSKEEIERAIDRHRKRLGRAD
jgi:hypothetical protein